MTQNHTGHTESNCKHVMNLNKSSMLLCSGTCCRSYTGVPRELTMSLLHDLGLDSQTCPHADTYMNMHLLLSYYSYSKHTCAAAAGTVEMAGRKAAAAPILPLFGRLPLVHAGVRSARCWPDATVDKADRRRKQLLGRYHRKLGVAGLHMLSCAESSPRRLCCRTKPRAWKSRSCAILQRQCCIPSIALKLVWRASDSASAGGCSPCLSSTMDA
jgi:hypothetical protein